MMELPPPPSGYERRMPRHEEAARLEAVGLDTAGREERLTPEAARAWHRMRQAAETDGVRLLLVSGFRSVARQTAIVWAKFDAGLTLGTILRTSAYPGHSEHHTGMAVDLGSPHCAHLSVAFASTPEFAWLQRHGFRHGFALSYPPDNASGIDYEPWHWRWRGLRDE